MCLLKSLPAIGVGGVGSSTWLWEVVSASLQNPSEGFYPGAIGLVPYLQEAGSGSIASNQVS